MHLTKIFFYNINLQKRGNDILGLSDSLGSDNLPYPTISYANGNGFSNTYDLTGARQDLSNTNFSDPYLRYMAMVALDSEAHGGDDVGVYASGPWSHLFTGNYEQNNIPVAMAYAARIGPYASTQGACSGAPKLTTSTLALMTLLAFFIGLIAI